MQYIKILLSSTLLVLLAGCSAGPVVYEDPAGGNPLTTGFTLSDLNQIADKMINSMLTSPAAEEITHKSRPILVVDRIQNRTDQHIDTESITDTIRTELIQSGKFRFTDKASRASQREELDFQNKSGMVDSSKAIAFGRQLGAQYIVSGSIVSYQERTSKTLRKSYKFTLNLINLETGIIEWADEKPITKTQRKTLFGS
tara:strand:- start:38423 stop:39019 length:597 start_codon:yes stop_codon:yes gene_type:complete